VPVGGALWSERPLVLIRAEDGDGHVGWGEAAPLDGFGPDSMADVLAAIASGESTSSLDFGRDCAVASVGAQARGETFADTLGPLKRSLVPVAHLHARDTRHESGVTIKVKIGRSSVATDIEAVERLVGRIPDVRIRLDANGSSSHSEAMKLAHSLKPLRENIEFVEEPWASCFDQDNRGDYPFAMAIDESKGRCDWRNADVCVLKPAISGSLAGQLSVMRDIGESGRQLVLSSSWESAVGRSVLVLMASRFEGPALGLGLPDPFLEDVHAVPTALFDVEIPTENLSDTPGDSIQCDELGLPIALGALTRICEITP